MVGGLGRKSRASLDLLVRPSHPPPHHHLVGFSFSSNLPLLVLRAGLLGRGAHDPVGHRVVPIQNNCRLLPILLVLRKSFGCTIAVAAAAAVAPTSWSFGPLVFGPRSSPLSSTKRRSKDEKSSKHFLKSSPLLSFTALVAAVRRIIKSSKITHNVK